MNLYKVFGLSISSDIPMPEFIATSHASHGFADVAVETGDCGADSKPDLPSADYIVDDDGHIVLNIEDIARYEIVAGERIFIWPTDGADPDDIRVFLLGSAFGALLHQRGLMPLHASATIQGEGAVAFSAPVGTGKSTMAAALAQRGRRIISDDVLALHPASDGSFVAFPGVPHIKVCPDVLDGLSIGDADQWPLNRASEKHHIVRPATEQGKGFPLKRIYFLEAGTRFDTMSIEPLCAFDSLNLLRANIYRDSLLALLGKEARFLQGAARLVQSVECYRLRRPQDLSAMPAVLDRLECHLDG